jgi:hypothetical protein
MILPLFFQETVMAAWLIVKRFNPPASESSSVKGIQLERCHPQEQILEAHGYAELG